MNISMLKLQPSFGCEKCTEYEKSLSWLNRSNQMTDEVKSDSFRKQSQAEADNPYYNCCSGRLKMKPDYELPTGPVYHHREVQEKESSTKADNSYYNCCSGRLKMKPDYELPARPAYHRHETPEYKYEDCSRMYEPHEITELGRKSTPTTEEDGCYTYKFKRYE